MIKKLITFVIVVLIISGAFYFKSVLSSQKKSPPQRQAPETINYVKVEKYSPKTIETNIEAYGRVGSSQQINLVAEVGGKLLAGSVPLKRGQAFRKGQLLCKIYSTEQKLNLQAQKSRFLNTLASILPDIKIDFNDSYTTWQKYFDSIELTEDIHEIQKSK